MRKPLTGLALAALALPAAATAQAPPDAAGLKRIEAKVPPQSWYPEGYYDIRIAAEGQIAEAPRRRSEMIYDWEDGTGKRYDVIDCGAEWTDPEGDSMLARYGNIALEISRIRSELAALGFPSAVYAEPLARYERQNIEDAMRRSDAEVAIDAGLALPETAPAEYVAEEDAADIPFEESTDSVLAQAIEANRLRLAPKLPRVVAEGGCGAGGGAPVIVRTSPPGGEVLMVNAFAFKVCTRKMANPWDRFACKWNEIETGVETSLGGRYVYQVRWPDGVVRRGTREIVSDIESETAVTETFKKTGS